MLDTYVLSRLSLWAAWRIKREDNGLGYPKKSNFVQETGGGAWSPEMESGCWDIEKCVLALIPERRYAVMQSFTVSSTKEQKAKACGCCIRTFDSRLSSAVRDILGLLNDLAAGLAIGQPETVVEIEYVEA